MNNSNNNNKKKYNSKNEQRKKSHLVLQYPHMINECVCVRACKDTR